MNGVNMTKFDEGAFIMSSLSAKSFYGVTGATQKLP
jgi:hypothetical protein